MVNEDFGLNAIQELIIEPPKCCGKKMHFIADTQTLIHNIEIAGYTCLVCGHYIAITDGQLDEEELQGYKETYGV